jgi:hypothetical protein
MAEAPPPSFRPEAPKPRNVVERVKNRVSPEQKRKRRMEKAVERRKGSVPASRIANIEAARRQKGRALNLEKDTGFDLAVFQEKQKFLTQHGLSREVSGNTYQLSPAEEAGIRDRAYAELAKSNPILVDYYRREGLYFRGPDSDGNCPIDHQADPFRRAIEQQAQALRSAGSDEEANNVLDSFARDCRDKAEMYAAAGDKGMQEALTRIGPREVVATPGQATPLEAAPATVNLAEQKLKTDLTRYAELKSNAPASMTISQRNEMRQLHKDYEPQITDAQQLADEFDKDPTKILTPDELDKLEKYKAFLKTPDATLPVPNAPAAAETPAQKQQREAVEYQKTRGPQAFSELSSKGVDFTKDEQAAMQTLKQQGWTEDPDTLKYIHAAFAENQRQQTEAALASLPPGTIDQLETDNRLKKGDLLGIIAALIALGVISVGKDAVANTTP